MDKLMQEAVQPFRARMFNRDNSKPKEKRILVLKTGIAGMQYYIENDEERKALVYGSTIYVTFEGKVMHFFDPETQKNLLV